MKRLTINIPGDRDKLYRVIKYPAGEIQVRLTEEGIAACEGKDEYVIQANPIPDIIELAQLKNALDGMPNNFYHTTLELMYLPYGRADRRFVQGDSFGLQVFANLINTFHFHTVYTFDAHSPVARQEIPNLINLSPVHHYDQILSCIRHLGDNGLVLIAPDKGAKARYDLDYYGLTVLEGEKLRDQKTGKLSGFRINQSVSLYDKALIVDDICDGGGTFVGLGEEIHRLNPDIELNLYVSHGIFSQGFEKLIQQFETIYVSDFSFKFPDIDSWGKI